jgi:hypothetical protein
MLFVSSYFILIAQTKDYDIKDVLSSGLIDPFLYGSLKAGSTANNDSTPLVFSADNDF